MTTFERVRYRPEGARARTIYLSDPQVTGDPDGMLGQVLIGVEVDREADEVAPRGYDERRHVISLDLVLSRTVVVVDRHTGLLTEPGDVMDPEAGR